MARKIGIIGCGNMGEAILAQSVKAGKARNFIIFEKDKLKEAFVCRIYKVKSAIDITDLLYKCAVIVIAVKPQDIDTVLEQIKKRVEVFKKRDILIISIIAGIKTEYIERRVSVKIRVIRAMPNLPAKIGEGITALTKGAYATDRDLRVAKKIFDSLGVTIEIPKERLIEVVTALSGSGPAYIFFIINAMLTAAKALGLDNKSANQLIYHTVVGAMDLHKASKFDAEKLISQVASKGGTTEAALKFFKDNKLNEIIYDGMFAAFKRAKELSRK
ncbi:MAG: pyrroline-5-carboxylate reductase [Candidatus Omnitrophica bacterium]|nr:pyrroline-5-carboxylate reductase [Candidatus Omnitrophota bacterium]